MIKLYHSNDLEVLKDILATLMRNDPCAPLQSESILVQSQGMAHWLTLKLADALGVAAHIEFPLPSSFVWRVFNQLNPSLPERSYFDKQILHWSLMRLLPELVQQPCYEPIRHYLHDDEHGIKCYQLAHSIADVFDQYLVYRPDWLLAWERGDNHIDGKPLSSHNWQPHLWRALVDDAKQRGRSTEHRAALLQTLCEQPFTPSADQLSTLPKRLFVFGIAALPEAYWQVLEVLSAHIDVHFFIMNPCRNYWGDIASDQQRARWLQTLAKQQWDEAYLDRGNPLLASWGRLGRDFLNLVNQRESGSVHDIEGYVDAQPSRLLGYIQHDILNLNDRQAESFSSHTHSDSTHKQVLDKHDDSLRIVCAHSALREVQRLHDQLWHWFEQQPHLSPDDVLVMVPDVDQYAPYFEAVFASAASTGDEHGASAYLPWALADQSLVQDDPMMVAFLSLLRLPEQRLQVSDVLGWLDVEAFRARFGIELNDISRVREWLDAAHIRWGADGEHRQTLGLPAFEQNSWHKGLRQLLLGLLLPEGDDGRVQIQNDWPLNAVSPSDSALLGQLMECIDALNAWRQTLAQPRSAQAWRTCLQAMIEQFFCPQAHSCARVFEALDTWITTLSESDYEADIPPSVVHAWLADHLQQQTGWQRFFTGSINVCTLMPMRSIPFKVVCLLGMNDSDYPRQRPPHSFDLLDQAPHRLGDRSRREDDRYLFLEAITSAQDHVYISYRGHQIRDNSELQPSVLVSECMDYVSAGFCLDGDQHLPHDQSRDKLIEWLVEQLPLQPFHAKHYAPADEKHLQVHSVNALWAKVANQRTVDATLAASASINERSAWLPKPLAFPEHVDTHSVAWADVKAAFLQPCAFFFNKRLCVRFADAHLTDAHADDEPFSLDGLSQYQLRAQLFELAQAQPNDANWQRAFWHKQQALGRLPALAAGELPQEKLKQQADALTRAVAGERVAAMPMMVHIHVDSIAHLLPNKPAGWHDLVELHGVIDCSASHHVVVREGKIRARDTVSLWLDVLFACASGVALEGARLVGFDDHWHVCTQAFRAPTQAQAMAQVQQLLVNYFHAWCEPQVRLPASSWQLAISKDSAQAWRKLLAKPEWAEWSDVYTQRFDEGLGDAIAQSSCERWLTANNDWLPLARDHWCEADD